MEQMNAVNPSERFAGNLNDDNESVQVITEAHVLPGQKLKHIGSTLLRKLKKKRKSTINTSISSFEPETRTMTELEVPVATKVEKMPQKIAHMLENLRLEHHGGLQRATEESPREGLVYNRIVADYVTPAVDRFINATQGDDVSEEDEMETRPVRREDMPLVQVYRVNSNSYLSTSEVDESDQETQGEEWVPVPDRRLARRPPQELDL